ncbi:DUF3572 domain-containing protein [Roseovarius aestuarii]|nr:DUF3572 domain-containing protein [Roseovarius aestuarii]
MHDLQNSGETIALRCLAWLIAHDELRDVFMGATGASEQDVRQGAQDPAFLGAVLDFVMMNDNWVLDFCGQAGLPGEALMQARQTLPGGQEAHWT